MGGWSRPDFRQGSGGDATLAGVFREMAVVVDAEFAHRIALLPAYSLDAAAQLLGNLRDGHAADVEPDHFDLAGRQPHGIRRALHAADIELATDRVAHVCAPRGGIADSYGHLPQRRTLVAEAQRGAAAH